MVRGYWEGKDLPIKGVEQRTYFGGHIKFFCIECRHEVEIICNTKVHKKSRSTRCCNERVYHPLAPEIEDYMHDNLGASPQVPPKAFALKKPSWIERLLQKLR